MREDKIVKRKGLVTGVLFSLCILGFAASYSAPTVDYSKVSGAALELTVSQPDTWVPLVIGPTREISFPNIPGKIGFYSSGDSSGVVKTFVILRDARGIDYEFLVSMGLPPGYAEAGTAGAAGKPGVEKPIDFSGAKPPFTFYGFAFYCRKPLSETTFYFDNVTLDGKLIEGFDQDNGWQVKVKPEQTQCTVQLLKEGGGPASISETFSERRENLIANSGMEEGIAGWEYGKEEYIPKDINGNPIAGMSAHGGKYQWENEGVESFHSISMEADTPGKWAGIFTVLKDIKPKTTYVLTFAHRMSRPTGFFLSIFGKQVSVTETFKENPEHWVRFTRAFHSGSCQGNIPFGFFVKAEDAPIKVGIDEVEMYEGFSPIGYDLSRLHLYYYNHTYVSPDVILPTRFQMENLFSDENVPGEFSYVFELPEDVTWEGFWCRWSFWSGMKEAMSEGKLTKEPVVIDGQKFTRYCFTLPLYKGSRFQKYFVPVSERDVWTIYGRGMGSSGNKTFTAFLGTKKKEGEFYGYYYARWADGQQTKRKFAIKVVPVDTIKPFNRFQANLSVVGDAEYCPQFSRQMQSLGIEGFTYHTEDSAMIGIARNAGIKRFSSFFNMLCFDADKVFEDALGIGPHGEHISTPSRNLGYCLSYRGKFWKEGIDAWKPFIDQGFTDFLLDDAPVCICYCDKCMEKFKGFLGKYTKLSFKDPRDLTNSEEDAIYSGLWNDFSLWHYGMTAKELRDELRAYAHEKYPGRRIMLGSSSIPIGFAALKNSFAADGVKQGLDYWTSQLYINWTPGFEGSPIILADTIAADYKAMGDYALPIMPNFGPGLDYCNPFNSLDPHAVMKYQMLETAFAIPMAGYYIYSAEDMDAGDLKYLAEFNKIVSKYEDVIIDGKPVAGVSCSGLRSSARLKELNGKYLLLVSNYSTYEEMPTTVNVTLPFAPEAQLKDVETGEIVAKLKGGARTFDITVGKSRARVFSFDPI